MQSFRGFREVRGALFSTQSGLLLNVFIMLEGLFFSLALTATGQTAESPAIPGRYRREIVCVAFVI